MAKIMFSQDRDSDFYKDPETRPTYFARYDSPINDHKYRDGDFSFDNLVLMVLEDISQSNPSDLETS